MDTTRELFPNVSDARSRQRLRKLFFVFPGGKCPPGAGIMYLHSSRCIKRAAVPEHPLRRALYLIRILRSSKVKCRSLTAVSLFTLRAGWFTSLSLSLKIQLFFRSTYKNHCAGEVSKIFWLAHKRVGDIDENSIFGHGNRSTCSTQSVKNKTEAESGFFPDQCQI